MLLASEDIKQKQNERTKGRGDGFRGRKATLNHASALVSACP